jgi:hypothetical protein
VISDQQCRRDLCLLQKRPRFAGAFPIFKQRLLFRDRLDAVVFSEIEIYFLGAIASFAALATRNFTTVFALI